MIIYANEKQILHPPHNRINALVRLAKAEYKNPGILTLEDLPFSWSPALISQSNYFLVPSAVIYSDL